MKRNILFIVLLFTVGAFAQTGRLYTTSDKLSSSIINQVYQDQKGRIWIATMNGLNVYDGYTFRTFKRSRGLANNSVNCITQVRNGDIYIGMANALQRYESKGFIEIPMIDRTGQKVAAFVTCIVERSNGEILITTSGYGIYRMDDDMKKAHQLENSFADIKYAHRIAEDRGHRIWVVTEDSGVFMFNGASRRQFMHRGDMKRHFTSICIDKMDRVFLGSDNNGLYRFIPHSSEGFQQIPSTEGLHIATLTLKDDGNLLLGCDGQGVMQYNVKDGAVGTISYVSPEIDLNKSKAVSVIEDKGGNLWIGLLQKGVYMQPLRTNSFGYLGRKNGALNTIGDACVMSVMKTSDGLLWVAGDNDGLYAISSDRQNVRHFRLEQQGELPITVLGMAEDNSGKLWVGTYRNGCGWVDKQTGAYHRLPSTQTECESVFDVAITKDDILWIGSMGDGLKRVNLNTGEERTYRSQLNTNSDSLSNCLLNDYIAQLKLSPDGKRLYVGTCIGLACLDLATNSWTKVFQTNGIIRDIQINTIQEDSKGRIWAGTSEGLYCYELKSGKTDLYNKRSGLTDEYIAGIELSNKGQIWVSTGHGLSQMDPETGKTINYFADDGLQDNEFSEGVSFADKDGSLIFGGMQGITWFKPADLRPIGRKFSVHITGMSLNGSFVRPGQKSGGYVITDSTVINSNRFELAHQDNSFSLNLSTLTFDYPDHITYEYSINGEPWITMPPGNHELAFSHMPSGTYRFRVKAIINDTESDIKEFTVKIHPVWYLSTWARLLYFMLIALGLYLYLTYRRRQEQARLRLQEHIHAEEMSEAKLRFFMNISHEIRTPMTLILTPIMSLIKEDTDPHRHGMYKTVQRNAERILHLINQMMDLRKIEKGQMMMRMSKTDFVSFVQDLYSLFEVQARSKNIELSYVHDTDRLPVWIDRKNFDKVVVNLLSNAFKFTPPGGKVGISLEHDDKVARLHIKDTGEGIPADKLEKIFERFYQTTSTVNDMNIGTGIGLDLTRSLVELHHGTIAVKNNSDGKGCEFTVTIPLGTAHLKPEEMIVDEQQEEALHELESLIEQPEELDSEPVMRNRKDLFVVVVEDDNEIAEYLRTELEHDYTVRTFKNGKEALPVILTQVPDVVISDIMMPEMDGNTLCSRIKANVNTNHIPVVLLTAKNRDEDRLQGLETGADAFLVKPFNMEILRRTIINLTEARKVMRFKYTGNESQESKVEEVKMKSPDEKLLERVMNVINKNINNSDLSVDMIADEVGISRVHLHRKMKELTNQTPHDFIRNLRLKQAANLLANQHQNVTEVMYACGFSNAASFSTIFKKFYGMSPRDYMKEHSAMSEE
ncbi:MAG: response regulator [Prevotella sp.]|nr:response regulator [Prevotella sp.]